MRDDDRKGGHIINSVHSPSYTFEDQVQELVEKTKDVPTVVFHCALSQQRCVIVVLDLALALTCFDMFLKRS